MQDADDREYLGNIDGEVSEQVMSCRAVVKLEELGI